MLAQEPDLKLVGAQHFTNKEVVCALIAQLGSAPCELTCGMGSYRARKSQSREAERIMSPARSAAASFAIWTIESG